MTTGSPEAGAVAASERSRSAGWWFAGRFVTGLILLYGISLLPFIQTALEQGLALDAWLTAGLASALGEASHAAHQTVISSRFSMTVSRGCDAVEPIGCYCAAIFSFPVSLGRKVLGAVMGGAVLFGLNLVRLATLFLIGLHWPTAFELFHIQIWPAVLIVAALFLIVGWTRWVAAERAPR